MIAKQKIQKLIVDKTELLQVNPDELREVVAYFPFSSSLALLYLESLFLKGDLRFQEELNRLAIRITDRSVLFDLVNGYDKEKSAVENLEPIESQLRVIRGGSSDENKISEDEALTELTSELTQTDEPTNILDQTSQEAETQNQPIDEVEMLIQASAAQTGYIIENENHIAQLEQKKKHEAAHSNQEEEFKTTEKTPILKNNLIEINEKDLADQEFSFNQWLNFPKNIEISAHDEIENPTFETIERPKKEFYSPIKKAKESLDEQKMPVSETLAEIFKLQGNFPKAIYVYEQLCLIYPKKKTYFALQIKEIKKKIK